MCGVGDAGGLKQVDSEGISEGGREDKGGWWCRWEKEGDDIAVGGGSGEGRGG